MFPNQISNSSYISTKYRTTTPPTTTTSCDVSLIRINKKQMGRAMVSPFWKNKQIKSPEHRVPKTSRGSKQFSYFGSSVRMAPFLIRLCKPVTWEPIENKRAGLWCPLWHQRVPKMSWGTKWLRNYLFCRSLFIQLNFWAREFVKSEPIKNKRGGAMVSRFQK